MNKSQIKSIENTIANCLRSKLNRYNPESKEMPFHYRLLGKDRMALYSFIQSLNTTFGTSIFEPVAVSLANTNPRVISAEKQFKLNSIATSEARNEIEKIIAKLAQGKSTDKVAEIEKIRNVCKLGTQISINTVKADLLVKMNDNSVYLIDLKTAKPNISNFKDFKRTLLSWVAVWLYQYPKANINSLIAIPYNPYAPAPYERWTMKGMLDLNSELLVAEDFWNFIAGKSIFEQLLDCFERVGLEMRPEIDNFFMKFK